MKPALACGGGEELGVYLIARGSVAISFRGNDKGLRFLGSALAFAAQNPSAPHREYILEGLVADSSELVVWMRRDLAEDPEAVAGGETEAPGPALASLPPPGARLQIVLHGDEGHSGQGLTGHVCIQGNAEGIRFLSQTCEKLAAAGEAAGEAGGVAGGVAPAVLLKPRLHLLDGSQPAIFELATPVRPLSREVWEGFW